MYLLQKTLVHKIFELANLVMGKIYIYFFLPQLGLKSFQHFKASKIYANPYKRNQDGRLRTSALT